ncbi:class I mannose-6-phosphate isomerase [Christensenellaceae bacterium OttesenSCG-928-K19]|nr:class I mannose-6-phosphate isomerase [Christensenellaceae bacterium OttesenSCG-928-K19]
MLYPLLLQPVYKEYLWGGRKLKTEYGKTDAPDIVAESWELAVHEQGDCSIANGAYAGATLREYLEAEGSAVLGANVKDGQPPVLIKLIDTSDSLSIQVHPDDEYAQSHHNCPGKTEFWYITACEPGAALYCGIDTISKEEFDCRAQNGSIMDVLHRVPVQKGDSFLIAPGTVHAIGKGMTVAEIGTNCNITYRIYDFGRTDKDGNERELHLGDAANVFRSGANNKSWETDSDFNARTIDCGPFTVTEASLAGKREFAATKDSFHYIACLEGGYALEDGTLITKGQSIFVPAGLGQYVLDGTAELLLVTI